MISSKSYSFVFSQKGWFGKLLVGGLLMSLPLIQAVTIGYQMKVISRLLERSEEAMPDWSDTFDLWLQGMKVWLANKLLYAPVAVATALTWSVTSGALVLAYRQFEADGFGDVLQFARGVYVAAPLILGLAAGMASIYALARLLIPAMTLRVTETGSFFSAFNPIGVLGFIFKNLGAYVLTTAMIFVILMVASTVILPIAAPLIAVMGLGALFGWFFLSLMRFYLRLVWAHALATMRLGADTALSQNT